MGWEPWIVVLVAFVLVGAAMRTWSWWLRERVVRSVVGDRTPDRLRRGLSLRVMVRGPTGFPGMASNRTHRTLGDLVLVGDRFVVTSGRGTLVDVGEDRGLRFASVRSPGPQKLVIEGEVRGDRGRPGRYRIEALLPDAADWVQALQRFVTAPSDGPAYAAQAPWSDARP